LFFLSEFETRPNPHIGHDELLSLIGRLHFLQNERGERGGRFAFEAIYKTYFAYTGEQDPYKELFNIIRYVAGEDFDPCLK